MDFIYNTAEEFCKFDTLPHEYKLQQQARASTSSSPFSENASDADWDAFLFGQHSSVQDTPMSVQSTSSVESEADIKLPKRHHAHITFVPSTDGLKPVVSRKRKRTAFTTEQVTVLETVFQNKPYVTREDRNVLVKKLAIADQTIKVWFQNRRLKRKKEIEEELEAMDCQEAQEYNMFPHTERLLHRVDRDGCVALNEIAIKELVTAIDAFLPKDLDLGTLLCTPLKSEEVKDMSSFTNTIHEPISPPEVGVSELETQEWWNLEMIDPKQSLQRLLDVHRSL